MSQRDNPERCTTCFLPKNIGFSDDCLHKECPYKAESEHNKAEGGEDCIVCQSTGKVSIVKINMEGETRTYTIEQVVEMIWENYYLLDNMHKIESKAKTKAEVLALLTEKQGVD